MTETLLYLLGILLLLLGVGLSIGLHELGHLWPAKAFKVPVSKYMIGFGPTLWSKKIGETEYGVKAIPLGGYIAMAGMVPPGSERPAKNWLQRWIADGRRSQQMADGQYDESRAFYKLPVRKRIVIMVGGPFANLVLGVVFTVAALSGIGVMQPSSVLGDVVDCVKDYEPQVSVCDSTTVPSPAKVAGLQAGDRVIEVNGKAVSNWSVISAALAESSGEPLNLMIERGSQKLSVSVSPVPLQRPAFGATGAPLLDENNKPVFKKSYVLGVLVDYKRQPLTVADSFAAAGQTLVGTGQLILQLPAQIASIAQATFSDAERPQDGPVSLVGVGNIAGTIASDSESSIEHKVVFGLLILGSLNFALFAFNLIPLLPLDGGHVLNACYEAAKRTAFRLFKRPDPGPFDTAKLIPFTTLMWFVLLGLGVLMMVADVVKPITLQ